MAPSGPVRFFNLGFTPTFFGYPLEKFSPRARIPDEICREIGFSPILIVTLTIPSNAAELSPPYFVLSEAG